MKRLLVLILLISLSFCVLGYLQCAKKTPKKLGSEIVAGLSKFGVRGLQRELDRIESPKDILQRGQTAIRLRENDTCDPIPILIYAIIFRDHENIPRVGMYFSDEDSDVVGFGIKEIRKTGDDKDQIIEESYPIFEHSSPPAVWLCQFPIEERTVGMRKDEELWKHYIENPSAEVLPPIIASIPDPNNVDVWVWLYDRAGNKSEPVEAVNNIKLKDKIKGGN